MKPSSPRRDGNLGQCEPNDTRFPFAVDAADQTSSPLLPGRFATPDNQGAPPVWRLKSCWVSYAGQDEVHVTIAVRKIPDREPNNTRFSFLAIAADHTSGHTIKFPSLFPGAPDSQCASQVGQLHHCWVSHAEQDELHVTIALQEPEIRTLVISVG